MGLCLGNLVYYVVVLLLRLSRVMPIYYLCSRISECTNSECITPRMVRLIGVFLSMLVSVKKVLIVH